MWRKAHSGCRNNVTDRCQLQESLRGKKTDLCVCIKNVLMHKIKKNNSNHLFI